MKLLNFISAIIIAIIVGPLFCPVVLAQDNGNIDVAPAVPQSAHKHMHKDHKHHAAPPHAVQTPQTPEGGDKGSEWAPLSRPEWEPLSRP